VEVFSSDDIGLGAKLRKAVYANPRLAELGAERLYETNRLMLRPGEAWPREPDGEFQFWVARAGPGSLHAATTLSDEAVARAAGGLAALISAAEQSSISIAIESGRATIHEDGGVFLARPGLPPTQTTEPRAVARQLVAPLVANDAKKRRILDASSLESLASAHGYELGRARVADKTSPASDLLNSEILSSAMMTGLVTDDESENDEVVFPETAAPTAPCTMTNLIATKLTDRGMLRPHNEDFVAARSLPAPHAEYEAWIVADGMGGGHQAGEVASKLAVGTLLEYLTFEDWTDPSEALRRGFVLSNERVHTQGRDMGTTLVAALVHAPSGNTWLAIVGDSRAYLISGDRIDRITHDHSVAQVRVDAGKMTQGEADRAQGKNVLTAAIGPEAHITPAVSPPLVLQPAERLLLCSDGLHTMLTDDAIAAMVRSEAIDDLPARLVAAANAAGGRDNISVLVGAFAGVETTVLDAPRRPRGLLLVALGAGGIAALALVAAAALAMSSGAAPPASRILLPGWQPRHTP